ncbi:hypothetical protein HYV88_05860 [Candidatus Woesearchaeota archaeon]|nr:hypothetical protein [Candidatus Woesearchaeota archaeon]
MSGEKNLCLQTKITGLVNYSYQGLITQIAPTDEELELLGFVFKGRLFEPAFTIGANREWLELTREYRTSCDSCCVPIIHKGIAGKSFFVHPFRYYSKIIGIIQEILGESYES